jgi:hypothetical protein
MSGMHRCSNFKLTLLPLIRCVASFGILQFYAHESMIVCLAGGTYVVKAVCEVQIYSTVLKLKELKLPHKCVCFEP